MQKEIKLICAVFGIKNKQIVDDLLKCKLDESKISDIEEYKLALLASLDVAYFKLNDHKVLYYVISKFNQTNTIENSLIKASKIINYYLDKNREFCKFFAYNFTKLYFDKSFSGKIDLINSTVSSFLALCLSLSINSNIINKLNNIEENTKYWGLILEYYKFEEKTDKNVKIDLLNFFALRPKLCQTYLKNINLNFMILAQNVEFNDFVDVLIEASKRKNWVFLDKFEINQNHLICESDDNLSLAKWVSSLSDINSSCESEINCYLKAKKALAMKEKEELGDILNTIHKTTTIKKQSIRI